MGKLDNILKHLLNIFWHLERQVKCLHFAFYFLIYFLKYRIHNFFYFIFLLDLVLFLTVWLIFVWRWVLFWLCSNDSLLLSLYFLQIIGWWYSVRTSASHSSASGHTGRSNGQTEVAAHACASMCDEMVVLWRLAVLDPTMSPQRWASW